MVHSLGMFEHDPVKLLTSQPSFTHLIVGFPSSPLLHTPLHVCPTRTLTQFAQLALTLRGGMAPQTAHTGCKRRCIAAEHNTAGHGAARHGGLHREQHYSGLCLKHTALMAHCMPQPQPRPTSITPSSSLFVLLTLHLTLEAFALNVVHIPECSGGVDLLAGDCWKWR